MCGAYTPERSCTMSQRPIRPIERQRMRPWLENLLDRRAVEGLKWRDRGEKIFEVPWRHGSRHGYNAQKDADLFERWARHTGRFDEKEPNPKKWKANFRCALNSLADVKEIHTENTNKESKCVRVYQFLDDVKTKSSTREGRRPYKRRKFPAELDTDCKHSADSSISQTVVSESSNDYEKAPLSKMYKYSNEVVTSTQHIDNVKRNEDTILPLPDSTSTLLEMEYPYQEIKKEPEGEVIEIECPLEVINTPYEFEIDRGVLKNHMSGYIMIINTSCDSGYGTRCQSDSSDHPSNKAPHVEVNEPSVDSQQRSDDTSDGEDSSSSDESPPGSPEDSNL